MRFAKIKLYAVKTLRIAFTVVAWLDLYSTLTHLSIFGFERNWGFLLADSITAFLLYYWEDYCYIEYAYSLAEDTMQDKNKDNNLVSFRGGKNDDNK